MEGGQGAMGKMKGAAEQATTKTLPGDGGACDVCGKVAAEGQLQKCGRCGWRCYCGAECQRKDWKQMGHKHVCKAIVGVRRGEVHLTALMNEDRVEEVRGLVLSGTVGVNDTSKLQPYGSLYVACAFGRLEMATMLVEVGADVELRTTDEQGVTPLFVAAQEGHDQIVRMLLERGGADPNVASTEHGATPLYMAAQDGRLDAVKVLVDIGRADVDLARTRCGPTPLYIAAQEGHVEIVRYLVQTGGADVNKPDHDGSTPLFEAARNAHLDVVKVLVRSGNADVNIKNKQGATPLHTAMDRGQTDVVKLLVRIGKADVNSKNKQGATPLHYAMNNGHTDVVKFLIRNGAQDTEFTGLISGKTFNIDDLANVVGDQTLTDCVASMRCSVCNKLCCKLKVCKGCWEVGYCSSACQKSDWKKHKKVCKMVIKVGDTVRAKGLVGAAHLNGRSGRVIPNPDQSFSRFAVLFEGDDDPSDAKALKPENLVVLRRP